MLRACLQFLLVTVVAAATAAPADNLLNSWQSDDGRGYREIYLRADGSFDWFGRMSMANEDLAISPMVERSGRWHIQGGRLIFDGIERPGATPFCERLPYSFSNGRLLLPFGSVNSHVDTYSRLRLPECESPAGGYQTAHPRNFIGSWRGHYRTHDSEFVFRQQDAAVLYDWDSGKPKKILDMIWKLSGSTLTLREARGKVDEDNGIFWKVVRLSRNCFTIRHGHGSMTYTFVRTKRAREEGSVL